MDTEHRCAFCFGVVKQVRFRLAAPLALDDYCSATCEVAAVEWLAQQPVHVAEVSR